MAKYKNAPFGQQIGVLGNLIGTTFLGIDVVKTRGTMSRVGNTLAQIANRAKIAFLSIMPGDNITINVKLINKVAMERTSAPLTGWNWFFKLNMPNLTVASGVVSAVDQPEMRYSRGSLPVPATVTPNVATAGRIRLALGAAELDPNTGLALKTSAVCVPDGLFVRPSNYQEAFSHDVSGNLDMTGLDAGTYHVYVWNQNAALSKSSETVYLGEAIVT